VRSFFRTLRWSSRRSSAKSASGGSD